MLRKLGRVAVCNLLILLILTCVSGFAVTPSFGLSSIAPDTQNDADPLFSEFKGVRIGMDLAAVKKKLGSPSSKGEGQNIYAINDRNTVQVFFDKSGVVHGIVVSYLNAGDAPTAKSVLGIDVTAKPDGSIFGMMRYEKAGFSVSYVRSAGGDPITTISVQKIQ